MIFNETSWTCCAFRLLLRATLMQPPWNLMKSLNFQPKTQRFSQGSTWVPRLYHKLEADGKGRKTIKAQHLWFRILEAQMETGTPYMLYKDHCNRKSNQQNLGIWAAYVAMLVYWKAWRNDGFIVWKLFCSLFFLVFLDWNRTNWIVIQFDEHFFQLGLLNHQLVTLSYYHALPHLDNWKASFEENNSKKLCRIDAERSAPWLQTVKMMNMPCHVPSLPRHHSLLQFVHGDHWVHLSRWSCSLQLREVILSGEHQMQNEERL